MSEMTIEEGQVLREAIRINPSTREVERDSLPKGHWLLDKGGKAYLVCGKKGEDKELVNTWRWGNKLVDSRT